MRQCARRCGVAGSVIQYFVYRPLSQNLVFYSSSWTCANYVSLFFICSFSFLIKKLQKRERTCRAYMKVLEQCLCPLCLLPSPPLSLCYCICPSQSSAACTVCTVMYSLLPVLPAFLSNCTQRQSYPKCFPSQREVISNYWGGFFTWMCMCLCVFSPPSMRWQRCCILFFILFFPIVCFLSVYSRLHVWMHNTTTQTNILLLHPSHYSFAEGFAALLQFLLLYETSLQYKTLLNIASNTVHLWFIQAFFFFQVPSPDLSLHVK